MLVTYGWTRRIMNTSGRRKGAAYWRLPGNNKLIYLVQIFRIGCGKMVYSINNSVQVSPG